MTFNYLIIEDEPIFVRLIESILGDYHNSYLLKNCLNENNQKYISSTDQLNDFLNLNSGTIDLIIIDKELTGGGIGTEYLERIDKKFDNPLKIIYSNTMTQVDKDNLQSRFAKLTCIDKATKHEVMNKFYTYFDKFLKKPITIDVKNNDGITSKSFQLCNLLGIFTLRSFINIFAIESSLKSIFVPNKSDELKNSDAYILITHDQLYKINKKQLSIIPRPYNIVIKNISELNAKGMPFYPRNLKYYYKSTESIDITLNL